MGIASNLSFPKSPKEKKMSKEVAETKLTKYMGVIHLKYACSTPDAQKIKKRRGIKEAYSFSRIGRFLYSLFNL